MPSARFFTRISPKLSYQYETPVNAIFEPSGDHTGPTPPVATVESNPSIEVWMSHTTSQLEASAQHWS